MYFEIIGEIRNLEVLAKGDSIADLARHPAEAGLKPSDVAGFAVYLRNDEDEASLHLRRLYAVVRGKDPHDRWSIRIIDESGEDYLFPKEWFELIDLPEPLKRKLIESLFSDESVDNADPL